MSSTTIVEHVVLLNVKITENVNNLLKKFISLQSLNIVSHIHADQLRRPVARFTHYIHGRFASKSDLNAYNEHHAHLSIIADINPLLDDILIVDWIAELDGQVMVPPPGSAARLTLLRPKEGIEAADALTSSGEVDLSAMTKVTKGLNFCAMSKGFDVALLSFFSSLQDLGEFEGIDDKIKPLVDDVIVVEFVM